VTVPKRQLGVDYGEVRIGLAVSDPDGKIASPFSTYERRSRDQDAAYFQALVKQEEIKQIVLGLPVHADGREGSKAAEVKVFGQWLEETTGLPVVYWDERFTTVEAEGHLWSAGLTHKARRSRRDRVAAQILLQSFLDSGWKEEPRDERK
jgi:putative holliday junction resolvase